MKRCLVAVLLALAASVPAQLTSGERKGIGDTLYVGNMTVKDLQFERRPFNDPYRLPLVNTTIDTPLEGADALMQLHRSGDTKSLAAMIRAARLTGLNDRETRTIINIPHPDDPELAKLPAPLRAPVKKLVDSLADANAIIKKAIGALTPEEERYLVEALPLYANEEPSIKFGYTSRSSYDATRVLALVAKVDLPAIRAAAEMLATSIEAARPSLETAARTVTQPLDLHLRINGLRVDIGGVGDNLHENKDAVLTIDLGGKDIYRGRHGAGIGYGSVLVDLGGDDLFEVSDLGVGAGILGVGLVYDIGGHDTFRCRSLSLGAGLAGVGAMYREGGKDSYEAVSLAQGFGEFGIGILADTAGDDRYDGNLNVQGAARTGGVGWLIDLNGADVYRAGGLILNSPLFEKVHYSNGQGYGSGYREDTGGTSGGIGLLTDFHGDDTYLGETYCQAASYWFSIGSLYDGEGNDTYTAYHYAQASAMHMTAAYLFDIAGDDAYVVKLGACHAIGHDYGVAFLLDRAGMDLYAAHDSRPAVGNANGLGIFVDTDGDDRYFGPPAAANPARGSGSLSVFADLGGTDQYADGLADGEATLHETWGVAYDQIGSSKGGPVAGTGNAAEPPKPGSLPRPDDAELEKMYAKATQWGVGTAQQEVADNIAKLIAVGKPAFAWMVEKHLASASRLEIRAFVAVMNGIGAEARAILAPKVGSENVNEARNALRIAVDGGVKEAAPYIPAALKKPELLRSAASAAGSLGSKESIPDLLALTINGDKLLALNAMVSLVALADPGTVSTAEALLTSDNLPIRKAAVALIAKFPQRAVEIGHRLMISGEERAARIGIELLATASTPEALDEIGGQLRNPIPGIRLQALQALDKRVPQQFRPTVIDLKKDLDPLVRAVAARIDLGR